MRLLLILIQKEFKQFFRDKILFRMTLVAPLIELLILPLAADYEIKNINISIVDNDHSSYSQKLISKIEASNYFKLIDNTTSFDIAFESLEKDKSDLILEIPMNFEKNLVRENQQVFFIAVNAINGVKANLGSGYLNRIIAEYNSDIRVERIQLPKFNTTPIIDVRTNNWFNPMMNYRFFIVPGILVVLITLICSYISTLNIVKEKEIGTIEQINVTPIKKYQFILGKLIPFFLIGLVVFSIGMLLIARLVYGIVPLGNLFALYVYLCIYMVTMLGFGLLISTYSETQQQAMSITYFFILIFILMSGLFTPIESMPGWAYVISRCSPVTYFVEVIRMIVLKGSGFNEIKYHFLIIFGFAVFINAWAIINYKKIS